jgi:hypothetical protein
MSEIIRAIELFRIRIQHLSIFFRGPATRERDLRLGHHVADGCSQLVRQVRGELRQAAERIFESREHFVERLGEFVQLHGQRGHRQTVVEPTGGHAVRHASHVADGGQPSPGGNPSENGYKKNPGCDGKPKISVENGEEFVVLVGSHGDRDDQPGNRRGLGRRNECDTAIHVSVGFPRREFWKSIRIVS